MVKIINKKGKDNTLWIILGVAAIGFMLFHPSGQAFLQSVQEGVPSVTPTPPTVISGQCPDDGTSDIFLFVQNKENPTFEGVSNTTVAVFNKDTGGYEGSIDLFTASTATWNASNDISLPCPGSYAAYVIADQEEGTIPGASSVLTATNYGSIVGDHLEFDVGGDPIRILAVGTQHAAPQFKLFDTTYTQFYIGAGDATGWEQDGANFTGTADNVTGTSVGASGELEAILWYEVNVSDAMIHGKDVIILMDGGTGQEWDTNGPAVTIDGIAISENKAGILMPDEQSAYAAYEWAYQHPSVAILDTPKHEMYMNWLAETGDDPDDTDDIPVIAFVVRGTFINSDSTGVLHQAVKDDSAKTQVYDIYNFNIEIV